MRHGASVTRVNCCITSQRQTGQLRTGSFAARLIVENSEIDVDWGANCDSSSYAYLYCTNLQLLSFSRKVGTLAVVRWKYDGWTLVICRVLGEDAYCTSL
jgi:hypothetical protein